MRHSTSTFFNDPRNPDYVLITDDGKDSFGWEATFRLGPITIFLKDQSEVFELVQKINDAYDRYLTAKPGGLF